MKCLLMKMYSVLWMRFTMKSISETEHQTVIRWWCILYTVHHFTAAVNIRVYLKPAIKLLFYHVHVSIQIDARLFPNGIRIITEHALYISKTHAACKHSEKPQDLLQLHRLIFKYVCSVC